MFNLFGDSKLGNIGNNLVDTRLQDSNFGGLYNYINSVYGPQAQQNPGTDTWGQQQQQMKGASDDAVGKSGTIPLIAPVSESQPFQLQKSQGIGSLLGAVLGLL